MIIPRRRFLGSSLFVLGTSLLDEADDSALGAEWKIAT